MVVDYSVTILSIACYVAPIIDTLNYIMNNRVKGV